MPLFVFLRVQSKRCLERPAFNLRHTQPHKRSSSMRPMRINILLTSVDGLSAQHLGALLYHSARIARFVVEQLCQNRRAQNLPATDDGAQSIEMFVKALQ